MLPRAAAFRAAEPAAAPVVITDAERQSLRDEIYALTARLAPLREREGISSDVWADADLFVKAARWAVDLVPTLDANARDQVQTALRRARERAAALEAGRHPWATRPGRSIRGFVSMVDGSTQPYGLVVPVGHDPGRPIRLDVVLHGSMGAAGNAELAFSTNWDGGDEAGEAPAAEFIELHPLGRVGENAYRFEGETDIDEAIASVCRQFAIDRRRIVLRGASLGGVGTWSLGLKRPDRYAALGPVCGPVDTRLFAAAPWKHFVRLEPITPWQETMLHLVDAIDYAANAGMVPVVAAMGDQDPYFPSHLQMEQACVAEGVPFVGLIDRGGGHAVNPEVLAEQLRLIGERVATGLPTRPPTIRFVSWTLKFSRCHWIELLGLDAHYRRAEIEAALTDDGSVTVTTIANITRFALHPPALVPVAAATARPTVTIDGTAIPLPATAAGEAADGSHYFVFEQRDGRWVCADAAAAVRLSGKRPGLQGPIDDAFSQPFLCVRGTGTPWNAAVGRWADASLRRFADEWRRHYRGDLPVKDDTAVTAADVAGCNLVLFGDPGSNRWIRDALPHLPIIWQADRLRVGGVDYAAGQHAVQLIHPNPLPGGNGRYIVLNSGHTYHDPELRLSYMVFPRLGDWAVTKVSEPPADAAVTAVTEEVVTSGFFDESWRLP
jgi:poly(3-hydroxybutyrate) depolymerase